MDFIDDLAGKGLEAVKGSSSGAVKTAAGIAGSAVKGAAIATTVAEGITWAGIATAAVIATVAPTAGATAAITALGIGAAVGNAIPIPGVGALIGAFVGALVAVANAFRGPNYTYIAKSPRDAKVLLELMRISPTFLPHLLGVVLFKGFDPDRLAVYFQGKRDPLSVEVASRMGGLRGDVDGCKFDAYFCVRFVKQLKLLAREGPGLAFKGPVVIPGALDMGLDNNPLAHGAPDYDALHEFDDLPLKYLATNGPWDYQRMPGVTPEFLIFGREIPPDPLLNPAFWKDVIQRWANGEDAAPVVKSRVGAQRVLGILRKALPAKLELERERDGGTPLDLGPLQNELKGIRLLAGEEGPDPVLGAVFGNVTVTQPVIRRKPSWGGIGALILGTVALGAFLEAGSQAPHAR